ncbi:hypothetical protein HMPREF1531_00075 [Propionibacterium sp. oral taxon 192 str. F0372]|uniref:MerR family transcriptional regulator n=1 Tax=Propionibacterium sp. oral taxon 192 TaxID=671222 RepID=UPI000353EE75|nr:MerR family transcriptional regulator [Propionibacterium sp. oral taxon 192]EPH07028.1 hypothetical protein HMPREF1531_00075 [Propionibacterium sp. oral taxon 192 str. F0372]
MTETSELMSIGEFSSLSRLSVRMLRHYDTHGVLVPASVDPWTGYRRYAASQLRDAADIRNLRDVGFGVSAISALLAARGTPAWPSALQLQRRTLVEELGAAKARLSLITRMLDQGEPMSITIERTTIPAMTVVALHGTVPSYSDEGQLWDRMMPAMSAQQITPAGPCGVIEHDDEFIERDAELSVFLPVASGTTAEPPLEILELPQRDCLVARVVGPYDQISQAHDLIAERMVADGLQRLRDGSLRPSASTGI